VTAPHLEALLSVQERDTSADRLRRRLATSPERTELASVREGQQVLAPRLAAARSQLAAAADAQDRAEQELAAAEARIGEVEGRLYSGAVSASRDLQAMAAEVDSLKRRRSSLEDRVLEAMDRREPLERDVAALDGEDAALASRARRLEATVAEADHAIETELASEADQRQRLAANVPGPLLARYEQLRARLGGVGAARLRSGSCSGCHLSLPATELDRLKREPEDAVLFCDQCGRILVR